MIDTCRRGTLPHSATAPSNRAAASYLHVETDGVGDALRNPDAWFTIQAHERRHRVAYATARADLLGLEEAGLFARQLVGKQFDFRPSGDLAARLTAAH